jgi:hypothetical protein
MAIERFVDPFDTIAVGEAPDIRSQILSLERAMKEQPQLKITPRHYIAHGLYAREITIPKGCLLTGKIHLFEHINIVSKGDISVLTDTGVKRIQAPATFIASPGIKRVGFAHEETVWTTIHAANISDPEKAEELLVVDSFEEYTKALEGEGGQCLSLP